MDDGVTPSCNCNLDNAATNLWKKTDMNKSGWKIQQRQAKSIHRLYPNPSLPATWATWPLTIHPEKRSFVRIPQRWTLKLIVLRSFTLNFSFNVSTWYSNHQILKHSQPFTSPTLPSTRALIQLYCTTAVQVHVDKHVLSTWHQPVYNFATKPTMVGFFWEKP